MIPFFNGFKRGTPEIPLEDFLTEDMKKKIKQYNLFYVIRPKADTQVFKIGISSGVEKERFGLPEYLLRACPASLREGRRLKTKFR